MSADFVYLASASPRRADLLTQIGVPFRLLDAAVDESVASGERAADYVTRLALAKAAAGARAGGTEAGRTQAGRALAGRALAGRAPSRPVLAADTTVVLDGRILGKPRDRDEGEGMLLALSARTHEVFTAVALATANGSEWRLSRSEVTFDVITAAQARAYWDTGEPCDKAGGYAVQGLAAVFVRQLSGSYSGVMGLPLYETAQLLQAAGVTPWR